LPDEHLLRSIQQPLRKEHGTLPRKEHGHEELPVQDEDWALKVDNLNRSRQRENHPFRGGYLLWNILSLNDTLANGYSGSLPACLLLFNSDF
jgi:hypothetical protein